MTLSPVVSSDSTFAYRLLTEALPSNIVAIVKEFAPEMISIAPQSSFLPSFVNLTDRKTMQLHVSKPLQKKECIDAAIKVALRIYNVGERAIMGASNKGLAFCMNPEPLSYAMQQCKGKIVLEIGGASGENAILFAYAGADKVYMNDSEPQEVSQFRKLCAEQPPSVQRKLHAVDGSCFELLQKHPELVGKVGVILCRSVIHLFDEPQRIQFFQLLKTLLKTEGIAILTANFPFGEEYQEALQRDPEATFFWKPICEIREKDGTLVAVLPFSTRSFSDKIRFQIPHQTLLYSKQAGERWLSYCPGLLPRDLYDEIAEIYDAPGTKKVLGTIEEGQMSVRIQKSRVYTQSNLENLVKQHGFSVKQTFLVGWVDLLGGTSSRGHVVTDEQLARQVGIIVQKHDWSTET